MNARRLLPVVAQLLFILYAMPAAAKGFGQADLEKMVAELDKVIPENVHYKYPIKCSIVAKDDVNAYATLTKEDNDLRATMVVYTGIVKAMKGDERLLRAVVAHELSHLSRGHALDLDPAARDLKNLWTRQQEYEADKYGAIALEKCGHSKQDMIDMLLFLDAEQGRDGAWLEKLTGDHADPKARAAELADNPAALKALVLFDTGLAYEDARSHHYAMRLFDSAVADWPALTEAYINSAKCSLLFYYDLLPKGLRVAWWRPDFGPLITTPHAPTPQGTNEVTDEDRQRWNDALTAITKAIAKNPGNQDAMDLLALAQVLEPDAKKDVVQRGIDSFKAASTSTKDDVLKLRYANNAAVGLQRTGDLKAAYGLIIDAQRGSDVFNAALGENLGLVVVTGRSKEDDTLAANVLFTWLSNTPPESPSWATVKKTFDGICAGAGIKPKAISQKPGYLCQVTTLASSGKDLGILLPVAMLKNTFGPPDQTMTFVDKWPDLSEMHWHNDQLLILTERGQIMRITSYEPDAHLTLKPADPTSQEYIQIKVGMSKDMLFAILNEKASVKKDLARGGQVESWNYFPDLNMGVLVDHDTVIGITVTPVQYEAPAGGA